MVVFTPLERTAIDAILAEIENRATIEQQLYQAAVRSRENTGGGFFTEIAVSPDVESLEQKTLPLGQDVWISIDGLEYGLGMILHLKGGWVSVLEGYAVGSEDTSFIDFEQVRFATTEKPGPFRERHPNPKRAIPL
jgi:hypothetical protein